MSLALPSLLLLVLLAPGFILLWGIRSSLQPQIVFGRGGFSATLAAGGALGVVIQVCFAGAVSLVCTVWWGHCTPIPTREAIVFSLTGDDRATGALLSVLAFPVHAFVYVLVTWLAALVLGVGLRLLIIHRHLDEKTTWLKQAKLHYLLTARRQKAAGFDNPPRHPPAAVLLTVDVNLGAAAFLYVGIVDAWVLDESGQLVQVVLKGGVYRRLLQDDLARDASQPSRQHQPASESQDAVGGTPHPTARAADPRWYRIKGERVAIDCRQSRTIAVDYWYKVDQEQLAEVRQLEAEIAKLDASDSQPADLGASDADTDN